MDKVKIPIDAKILFQMFEYAHAAKKIFGTEIAGWGHYNKDKGIYKLAPLIKQEVSGAEVSSFPNELINDTKYDISDMLVQWHSHVMFGCTPSTTDNDLIKDVLKLMPMVISVIVNCKGEYTANVAIKHAGVFAFEEFIKLDVELVSHYDNPLILKEVKKKCHKPKPAPTPSLYGEQYGRWDSGVYIPNNKHVGFNNAPNHNKLYKTQPDPKPHLPLGFYGDGYEGDFFPDYGEVPAPAYKKMMEYDDIIKIVKKIVNEIPTIDMWEYEDYTVLLQPKSNAYLEISPSGVMLNSTPMEWNEAIKRFGIYEAKYQLTKNNENKV